MILNVLKNPKQPEDAEDIVQVTMTRDQFAHLRDCVTLAYQSAQNGSRMMTITSMVQRDFDVLADELERIDEGNRLREASAHEAPAAPPRTSPSRNYTYVVCRECALRGTLRCRNRGKPWNPSVIPGCVVPVEYAGEYRKAKEGKESGGGKHD